MHSAAIAATLGVVVGALFDVFWVNLFVAGVGGFLLGVIWMPVLAALFFASKSIRQRWSLIAAFALTYTPTQFLVRAFIHEPSGSWPLKDTLVVLWSNLWFAAILSAAVLMARQLWSKLGPTVANDA